MPDHINSSNIKRLLSRRGSSFVEKNHPEAVKELKKRSSWDDLVEKYDD